MKELLQKLGERVMGVLSGFDRLLIRGVLRCVINPRGGNGSLDGARGPMVQFEAHVQQVSKPLIDASLRHAEEAGGEIRYLDNSQDGKKDLALEIARRDGRRNGPICVLKCVEPCVSFRLRRDRDAKKISLESCRRKCLHLDHDFDHPQFGLLHVRGQTWFPFTLQVCLNGREWLAKSLDQAGLGDLRRDNCVCQVDDLDAAQRRLDEQLPTSWPGLLNDLRRVVHPAHEAIFANCPEPARQDSWSVAESEWASDVLFRNPADVLPLTERLAAHSLRVHGVAQVMRFLGRTVCVDGLPRESFGGDVRSDVRTFEQGLRIKPRVNANSVKMSNRPDVLRFETTINNPSEFQVWRTPEQTPDAEPSWLRLRNPLSAHDMTLLTMVSRPEFVIAGLRNQDLRQTRHGADPSDPRELRRRSSAVGRQLAWLRAHGLLEKIPQSPRDRVPAIGRRSLTALLAAANATTAQLTQLAV